MQKIITIDDNQFICDNEYLLNVLRFTKNKPYTNRSNLFEYRWINYPDNYEKAERTLIKKYIKPHHLVLELGGNIGTTSCLINKIIDNKSSHVVSEIDQFFRTCLYKHKIINNCQFSIIDRINLLDDSIKYDAVVSDIEGDEYLFLLDNQNYIEKNVELMIIEFHTRYACKNNRHIDKNLIAKTHTFLNKNFQKIDHISNTYVYKRIGL
jgi:hypothetical protein